MTNLIEKSYKQEAVQAKLCNALPQHKQTHVTHTQKDILTLHEAIKMWEKLLLYFYLMVFISKTNFHLVGHIIIHTSILKN